MTYISVHTEQLAFDVRTLSTLSVLGKKASSGGSLTCTFPPFQCLEEFLFLLLYLKFEITAKALLVALSHRSCSTHNCLLFSHNLHFR